MYLCLECFAQFPCAMVTVGSKEIGRSLEMECAFRVELPESIPDDLFLACKIN